MGQHREEWTPTQGFMLQVTDVILLEPEPPTSVGLVVKSEMRV